MRRREILMLATTSPWAGACVGAGGVAGVDVRGIGMVVEYELAPRAKTKKGVNCSTDTGYRLFGPSELNERNGGTLSLGGATIPRWVRVTWREGVDEARGLYWTTGKVVGDYTVPVLERIPKQAFDLSRSGRKQPLVLRFRIRDDDVDFGWMVRLQDGVPFEVLMRGGDF